MSVVDARGQTCPRPVIMTARELDRLAAAGAAAEAVDVLADEMVAVENLKRLAASRGRAVEIVEEGAGAWRVRIAGTEDEVAGAAGGQPVEQGAGAPPSPEAAGIQAAASSAASALASGAANAPVPSASGAVPPFACVPVASAPAAPTVIAVGSDGMGRGDDELGSILLKGLIYAYANAETPPATMVFFNSGARMTCAGSPALDDLRQLEEHGCEVLTCGTCLDFFGIKDELAVGGVTNLYRISELFAQAGNVVSL